jgi:membrane protein required for colicin V production
MIFDILIIAVVLISALHAFWRGFIREILTIFGAIGGLFATLAYGDDLRPLMDSWLGVADGADGDKLFGMVSMSIVSAGLSYLAIFVLVFGVLSFIAHLIAEQVRALGLGAVDRTLGVVFGLARGLLIVGIFYLPLHILMNDDDKESWFKESHTHVIVSSISSFIESALPDDMMPFSNQSNEDDAEKPSAAKAAIAEPRPEPKAAKSSSNGYTNKDRSMMESLIDAESKPAVTPSP